MKEKNKILNKYLVFGLLIVGVILIALGVFSSKNEGNSNQIKYYKYYGYYLLGTKKINYYTLSYRKITENDEEKYIGEETYKCKDDECKNAFSNYEIQSVMFDTEAYGFILSDGNNYYVYRIDESKLYPVNVKLDEKIEYVSAIDSSLSNRDNLVINTGNEYIFNYKTNEIVYGGFKFIEILSVFNSNLYCYENAWNYTEDPQVTAIFDKKMNFITESKKVDGVYELNDKIYVHYADSNEINIYNYDGKLDSKKTINGEILYINRQGYYAVFENNQTILFDGNGNKIVILANERMEVSYIHQNDDDIVIMINSTPNTCYKKDLYTWNYTYNIKTNNLTKTRGYICENGEE